MKIPIEKRMMNGRRRPKFMRHRSLSEPKIGVRKKPINGDRAHTSVICWCWTPMLKSVGDTNAVSAAYENSIPITAADTFTNSLRVFDLQVTNVIDKAKSNMCEFKRKLLSQFDCAGMRILSYWAINFDSNDAYCRSIYMQIIFLIKRKPIAHASHMYWYKLMPFNSIYIQIRDSLKLGTATSMNRTCKYARNLHRRCL